MDRKDLLLYVFVLVALITLFVIVYDHVKIKRLKRQGYVHFCVTKTCLFDVKAKYFWSNNHEYTVETLETYDLLGYTKVEIIDSVSRKEIGTEFSVISMLTQVKDMYQLKNIEYKKL